MSNVSTPQHIWMKTATSQKRKTYSELLELVVVAVEEVVAEPWLMAEEAEVEL